MVIRILSFLDPQHFVFCGRKNIILADYLIDDNPKQLEIFEGKSIMFTASHNVNEHRFERVSGWRDVKIILIQLKIEDKSHRSLYLMAYDFL